MDDLKSLHSRLLELSASVADIRRGLALAILAANRSEYGLAIPAMRAANAMLNEIENLIDEPLVILPENDDGIPNDTGPDSV
jgi:hypothetical protein